jgi:hypothetical protein
MTLTAIEQKVLTAADTLLIVELVSLADGEAQIELKSPDTKVRLSTNAPAELKTQPIKLQIAK